MIRLHNYGPHNWKEWKFFYNEKHQRYNIGLKDRSYAVSANKKYSPYLNAKENMDVGFTTISKISKYLMLNIEEKTNDEDIIFISIAVENADLCKITLNECKILYKDIHYTDGLEVITMIVRLEHALGFVEVKEGNSAKSILFSIDKLEVFKQKNKAYLKYVKRLYLNYKKRIIADNNPGANKVLRDRNSLKIQITADVERCAAEKMSFCRELKQIIADIQSKQGVGLTVTYDINTVEINGKKYYYHLSNLSTIKLRLSSIIKYPEYV